MKKLGLLAASIAMVLVGCGGSGSDSSGATSDGSGNSGSSSRPETSVDFDTEYNAKLSKVAITALDSIPSFDLAGECQNTDVAFKTDNFVVGRKSNQISEAQLEEFAKVIESAYQDVLKELSVSSADLPARNKKYQSCVRLTQDSGGNAFYGGFNLDSESNQNAKDLYRMAMHELTHMVQLEIAHGAPNNNLVTTEGYWYGSISERWFNEGLAYTIGQKEFAHIDELNTFISKECFNMAPSELKTYYQAYPEKWGQNPGQARAHDCLSTEYPTYAVQFQYLSDKYGMTKENVIDLFKLQRDSQLDFSAAYNQTMTHLGGLTIDQMDRSFVTSTLIPWLQSQFATGEVKSDVAVSEIFVSTGDYYYGDIDAIKVDNSTGRFSAYLKRTRDGLYKAYFLGTDDKLYGPAPVEVVNGQFKNNTLDLRGATVCPLTNPICSDLD